MLLQVKYTPTATPAAKAMTAVVTNAIEVNIKCSSCVVLPYTYTIAQVGPVVNQKNKIKFFPKSSKSLDALPFIFDTHISYMRNFVVSSRFFHLNAKKTP